MPRSDGRTLPGSVRQWHQAHSEYLMSPPLGNILQNLHAALAFNGVLSATGAPISFPLGR